jgi:hypothetical protein
MLVHELTTNLARAEVAWGGELPRWIKLLADACDKASQRAVADRLSAAGFSCSSGTISKLLNRKYPASMAEPERAVLATFGGDDVACPLHGLIPLQSCIRNRRRKGPPRNAAQHEFAAACPSCPFNSDGGDL